jgi:predicted outer membrane repeat protein
MTVTQDTVIQGGGVITITGGLTTRLFHVMAPAALALYDITLDAAYGVGGDGGAILASGPVYLTNVIIQYSQTSSGYCGGAIWSNGAVYISRSTFRNNTGGSGGGAICTGTFNAPTVQIANSTFYHNVAVDPVNGYGGAIMVNTNAHLSIVDSSFTSNAAHYGGALYVAQGGSATIRTLNAVNTVTFLSNSATDSGGAIWNEGALSLSRVNLVDNTVPTSTIAVGYGGGIGSLGTLALYDGYVAINEGRFGGGLFVGGSLTSARADVQRTIFNYNLAGSLGGGLYTNVDTTVITVTNSVFYANTAVNGGGAGRFNARLKIINSSFAINQASGVGGGLSIGSGPTVDPTYVSITSATFSGNTAGGTQGGGIYNQGYSVLKNLTFKDNSNGIFTAGTTHLGNSVLDNPGFLNCDGNGTPISSDGYNLSTDNSCVLEQNGVPAQLGPLESNNTGYNGTLYHLPLAGSPLINAAAGCPTLDQRGATRPDTCDIGAVEYGGLAWHAYLPIIRK